MSKALEEKVWELLRTVKFPGMSRDVVSFGFVKEVDVEGAAVAVKMRMATQNESAAASVKAEVEKALEAAPEVESFEVQMQVEIPPSPAAGAQRAVMQDRRLLPQVSHVVAVASGKGGVGKSTVSSNLAVTLGRMGYRVGILDADIYGPSIPTMFGIEGKPRIDAERNRILPFEKFGVKVMSLGFLIDTDTPVIWRGPMVMKALEQLLGDVDWGELDYLIVDLPPGTGDAQLTLTQKVPLSGAVVVTTPQDVALIDARKGLAMFRKVNVPVVGIIENMSTFVCPHCGETTDVFKRGGGERTARELTTTYLGDIPLDARVVEGGDAGVPIAIGVSDGPHAKAFLEVGKAVVASVEATASTRPKISIV